MVDVGNVVDVDVEVVEVDVDVDVEAVDGCGGCGLWGGGRWSVVMAMRRCFFCVILN